MYLSKHYLKKVCNWLLPYTCILCGQASGREQDLCGSCYQALPILKQRCIRCAIPIPLAEEGLTCGQCLQKAPPYDNTHALFHYEAPITQLILELKFKQALVNARVLGELLAASLQQEWYTSNPLPEIIIPIPLHPKRLKERGFNQAVEIARPVAKALRRPLNTQACSRLKPTLPQSTLSAIERQKNVKDAFFVSRNFTENHVAVIDDVITTGNTMREFCNALKQQGVHKIDVWCCARAGGLFAGG